MPETAWLSLGSNVERERHIHEGLDALAARFGALRVSSVYESAAVGFDGPAFYNLAVGLETDLAPEKLVEALRIIEDHHGRDRSQPRFSDRTLDIDLLLLGSLQGRFGDVELPRPDITRQPFVLGPLAEIAPDLVLPGTDAPLSDTWKKRQADALSRVPFDWQGKSLPLP